MNAYEKTSLFISSIGLISLLLIWWQIRLSRIQVEADHERSRRQMTIDLMMKWVEMIDTRAVGAKKIVDSLDGENCERIFEIERAKIPISQKTLLEGVLEISELESKNDYFEITDYHASVIRSLVLKYLNSLETILTGWRLGVSDKTIIEEEFSYLYDDKKQKGVLHEFRHIAGVHGFPSIDAFCKSLSEKHTKTVETKGNVI